MVGSRKVAEILVGYADFLNGIAKCTGSKTWGFTAAPHLIDIVVSIPHRGSQRGMEWTMSFSLGPVIIPFHVRRCHRPARERLQTADEAFPDELRSLIKPAPIFA